MFSKLKGLSTDALGKAKALSDRATQTIEASAERLSASAALTRDKGREVLDATTEKGGALVEKHWPAIERVIVDGLLTVAADKLNDDKKIEQMLERGYEMLPLAIRFVLPRDRYLQIAIQKKQPLLAKIEDTRTRRQAEAQLVAPALQSDPDSQA